MLVLSREKGEQIIIADRQIVIKVLDIVGDQVRIGIDAPRSIEVHREEIYDRIQAEKKRDNK